MQKEPEYQLTPEQIEDLRNAPPPPTQPSRESYKKMVADARSRVKAVPEKPGSKVVQPTEAYLPGSGSPAYHDADAGELGRQVREALGTLKDAQEAPTEEISAVQPEEKKSWWNRAWKKLSGK